MRPPCLPRHRRAILGNFPRCCPLGSSKIFPPFYLPRSAKVWDGDFFIHGDSLLRCQAMDERRWRQAIPFLSVDCPTNDGQLVHSAVMLVLYKATSSHLFPLLSEFLSLLLSLFLSIALLIALCGMKGRKKVTRKRWRKLNVLFISIGITNSNMLVNSLSHCQKAQELSTCLCYILTRVCRNISNRNCNSVILCRISEEESRETERSREMGGGGEGQCHERIRYILERCKPDSIQTPSIPQVPTQLFLCACPYLSSTNYSWSNLFLEDHMHPDNFHRLKVTNGFVYFTAAETTVTYEMNYRLPIKCTYPKGNDILLWMSGKKIQTTRGKVTI